MFTPRPHWDRPPRVGLSLADNGRGLRPTNPEPACSFDGDGPPGARPSANAKYPRTFVEGQEASLKGADAAFPGDGQDMTRDEDRSDTAGGIEQIFLTGLVRDGRAGPGHQSIASTAGHVLLLRPEERQAWTPGQRRHQDERIRPRQVIERVDRRHVRQQLTTVDADAQPDTRQDRDDEPRQPVPDGLADRVDPLLGSHLAQRVPPPGGVSWRGSRLVRPADGSGVMTVAGVTLPRAGLELAVTSGT